MIYAGYHPALITVIVYINRRTEKEEKEDNASDKRLDDV